MAQGVEAIHKQQLVHRDIKPENILITEDLHIKISDFGLTSQVKYNHILKTWRLESKAPFQG